jgi:hypothetical protein
MCLSHPLYKLSDVGGGIAAVLVWCKVQPTHENVGRFRQYGP